VGRSARGGAGCFRRREFGGIGRLVKDSSAGTGRETCWTEIGRQGHSSEVLGSGRIVEFGGPDGTPVLFAPH
jgi:hypothetical protein